MLLNAVFDLFLNAVFNMRMHADAELIKTLGGPTRVAELLRYDKARGGVQRVQNWRQRGIPAAVKLSHPELFLAGQRREVSHG